MSPRQIEKLPKVVRTLFWDYDVRQLGWDSDRNLIVARVLAVGTWKAVKWLRSQVSDGDLREWILQRHGAGLTPKQLRFWEVILDLPHRDVDRWLRTPTRAAWDRRTGS